MTDNRPGVFITVCNQGWVHKNVTFALLKLIQDKRFRVRVSLPVHVPYENALQHCVNDFLNSNDDWWLNFDSDNPPQNNPLNLISMDLDIVGCPTPVWNDAGKAKGERCFYWNAYREQEGGYTEWPIKEGLQKVDAVGTGCVLYSKNVFLHEDLRIGAFQRTYNPIDGTVHFGNDIAFCRRAKLAGFSIWAHYDYPCDHFNELSLNSVISSFVGVDNGTK